MTHPLVSAFHRYEQLVAEFNDAPDDQIHYEINELACHISQTMASEVVPEIFVGFPSGYKEGTIQYWRRP